MEMVAVVTGGASGIGRGHVESIAARGVAVASLDLSFKDAPPYNLPEKSRVERFESDVTNEQAVTEVFRRVEKELGPVSILVNNVGGVIRRAESHEYTVDEFNWFIATNLTSAWLCSRAVIPGMRQRRHGRIVNTASDAVDIPVAGLGPYIAAKGGIVGLTRALAFENGDYDIAINALSPGFTPTASAKGYRDDERQRIADMCLPRQAHKVPATPADHGALITWLALDAPVHLTGQVFHMNGGYVYAG
jgi:NAD(P)-dependent dehydrogenase (short-subunit alcohol dehydrogenase family)